MIVFFSLFCLFVREANKYGSDAIISAEGVSQLKKRGRNQYSILGAVSNQLMNQMEERNELNEGIGCVCVWVDIWRGEGYLFVNVGELLDLI